VGLGDLPYELGARHVYCPVDSVSLRPHVVPENFHHALLQKKSVRATIADLEQGNSAGELRWETEPEVVNDAIFGAIYYRMLLRSGPLTRRFGEELVDQLLRAERTGLGLELDHRDPTRSC
jgi:hypothetical protein